MRSLALLQLNTIATNKQACASSQHSRTFSSAFPLGSRRAGLPFISINSNSTRERARIARVQIHASQSPNPFGGGGGNEEGNSSLIADLALPAAGILALLIGGSYFGGFTAIIGLPLIVTGVAAAFGVLDSIAAAVGTTPLVAAAVVASTTLGITLIPAFLKFGFIALAGFFVFNLLFGGGGGSNRESDPDVTSGSSSYYDGGIGSNSTSSSYRGRNQFDATDVTIDVEAESIDD